MPHPGSVHDRPALLSSPPCATRFITLEDWLTRTYGAAIGIDTARRWVRQGRIAPRPEKIGRTYFLAPSARYVDPQASPRGRLIDRLDCAPAA